MKKIIIPLSLVAILIYSCSKEETVSKEPVVILSELNKDQIITELAQVLSLALRDKNVREFIHSEIEKQFTLDYDITYELIKDKSTTSEKYDLIEFGKLLEKVALENSLNISYFVKNHNSFRNLQISSPVYFKDWVPENTSPMVISLPQNYDEGKNIKVKAFLGDGTYKMVLEEEINEPILLVREAERIDMNGMMTIDIDGFIIPEKERYLTAKRAYEIANEYGSGVKSAAVMSHDPVIVIGDIPENKIISENDVENNFKLEINNMYKGISDIGIPTTPSALPNTPYCIQVKWGGVTGAVRYEIFRQYGSNPNILLATVDNTQNIYNDMYLTSGTRYLYSLRSIDASGNTSGLTYPVDAIASWRTNRVYEKIIKIYVSKDCWNKAICGLFDGRIELQYKLVLFNRENKVMEILPAGEIGPLEQQTRNAQKDTWCSYNHLLFLWDLQIYGYSYGIYFVEDDTNGNGTTIELSATIKVSLADSVSGEVTGKITFTIADADEKIGSMVVHYDTNYGSIFSIVPIEKQPVGTFKVVFGQ